MADAYSKKPYTVYETKARLHKMQRKRLHNKRCEHIPVQRLWELHGKQEVRQKRSQKFEGKRKPCLSCSRCKALVKCVTCKNGYEKGYWSTTARKNAKHKGYALVCKECRKRGCTSRNPALYTCTTCSEMFGTAKLDAINIANFKQNMVEPH